MNWIAIPLAGVTVVSTLAGGAVALRMARELTTAIALTGGIVVAVALFEVLPEAIEAVDDPHLVGTLVGAGFVFFFLAERALVLHHRDDDAHIHAHAKVGALGAAGLSLHSFIDGLGIGLAFGLSTETGLLVFVAVVAHDFADGLNTVGFVLRQSGDRARAIRWLAIDAAAPLAGAIVGTMLSISEQGLGGLLAVYAGFFLFMGATDLLPHAHEHPSVKRVALTLAGFARDLPRQPDRPVGRRLGVEPAGELAEAVAGGLIRPELLVLAVARIGGDLLGDGANLPRDRLAVLRRPEQELHPAVGAVVGRHVVVDQQLAQLHADADVGERAERQDAARRADEALDLGVVGLDLRDDAADRLVDERKPDLLVLAHGSEGYGAVRRDRHASCAATPSRKTANSRLSTFSGSAVAIWTPTTAPAIEVTPSMSAVRQRTLP